MNEDRNKDAELDARAREWANRLLEHADTLESAALEWKVVASAVPEGADEIDPAAGFAIPHAAVVMDSARDIRSVATAALSDF